MSAGAAGETQAETTDSGMKPTGRAGWSLKRKAYDSALWTVVGFGIGSILRLAGSMVLTRLLDPRAVGMMTLINTIVRGFELFTDVGVGYSIVREKRGTDPAFLNTAWTLQVVRGFALSALIAGAAWPLEWYFGRPGLGPLLAAAGLEVALSGLNSTLLVVFRRNLELHRTVRLQILDQAIYLTSAVILAFWLRSVWAYVIASWIAALARAAVGHYLNRQTPNRLHWDPDAARLIFRFGRWVFLSTLLTFLAAQVDRLMLAKILPLAVLGIYGVAANIADIPRSLLVRICNLVVFPAISRRVDLPRAELCAKMTRHRWAALLMMAGAIALLSGTGDLLIRALYDPRFHEAAWVLPILVLGLWPRVIATTVDGALKALGRLQYEPAGSVLRLAVIAGGLPIVHRNFGLPGVVVLIASSDLFNLVPSLYGRWRHGLSTTAQDLLATGFLLAILGVVLSVRAALGLGTPFDAIPWGRP